MICRSIPFIRALIFALGLTWIAQPRMIPATAQSNADQAVLIYNAPVTARLGKGETHRYPLVLPKGQYAEIEAKALSGDITMELRAPDGPKLMKMKARNGIPEGTTVAAAAEEASTFFVVIAARDPQKDNIEYQVHLTQSRPAETADRERCQGEYLFAAGEEIYDQRTKEGYLAALDKYRAALPYYEKAQDWFGAARAIETMGEALYHLTNYHESLASFENALAYVRRVKETAKSLSLEAKITSNIGAVADRQYEKQKALMHFLQAVIVYRKLNNRFAEATCYGNIGNIYSTTGQPEEAMSWYERSLSIGRELNSDQHIAVMLNNLGGAKYFEGKYEDAIKDDAASLNLWRKLNDPGKQGWTMTNIAASHIALIQPQTALNLLSEALPLIRKSGDQRNEAYLLHCLGDAHRLMNQYDAALEYYQQAVKLRQSQNERIQEAYSISKISETERLRGNDAEALLQSNRALGVVEQVRRGYSNPLLGAAYTSSTHHYYAEHISLLLKLHKQKPDANYDVEAFQTCERAYARSFLESLAGIGEDQRYSVPAALAQRETNLHKSIDHVLNERSRILKGKVIPNEKLLELNNELQQKLAEMDVLQGEIRAASPSILRPQPLGLAEVQRQLLSSDSLLLEYFIAQDRLYLFAVSGDDGRALQVFEIDDLKTIEKSADFFRREKFENPEEMRQRFSYQNPKFAETVLYLSEKLLSPVKTLLSKRKIWIVSDGALQQIPFAALPDPNKNAQLAMNLRESHSVISQTIVPFLVDHEIVSLPSASITAWLRKTAEARPAASQGIAILADPVFSTQDQRVKGPVTNIAATTPSSRFRGAPDLEDSYRKLGGDGANALSRLIDSRFEAQQIARLSPGKNLLALDFDANRGLVMSGALHNYRYLHFGTHAFVDDRFPGLSWLALSQVDRNGRLQPGYLRLNDLYQLRLNADLVVLGACRTGLGKKFRGEGMIGLSRGFIYAGVSQVMVSLWDISDRETARFMERFYRNLLKTKLPADEALRLAQVETWKHSATNAPFFWAAFSLQGDPTK
jgi:CHAT domain-containing protein/tetratricopeptide (TPR) repeat protein